MPSRLSRWCCEMRRFDCLDGNGPIFLLDYGPTAYLRGAAEGETGRNGGELTGMGDDQHILQYRSDSGWTQWTNHFKFNYTTNWATEYLSVTHYDTFKEVPPLC
jgi:hypothetical protein